MNRPVLNIADLEYEERGHGEKYGSRRGRIGERVGAQKLGYNITVIAPGKRAFPLHNHYVNEEMFFILEGEGEIRIGPERHKVRPGDVIACVTGGPDTAHQMINTSSTAELKYLAVSTKMSPEFAEYPESGKFGIWAELTKSPGAKPELVRFLSRLEASLDYWDGE